MKIIGCGEKKGEKISNSLARARIKEGRPGQMRCSNMAADSKTEKKLGHNLTVARAVLRPKKRLCKTTGRYIVKYTL